MPGTYTYPGVYVEEVPSGVRTITGVSTAETAFVDFFPQGTVNVPTRITSYADFERQFGGLDTRSEASYAVNQYFLNGGRIAWIVRMENGATAATVARNGESTASATLNIAGASPGTWGDSLEIGVDYDALDSVNQFNLAVRRVETVGGRSVVVSSEVHRNLSMASGSRNAVAVVNASSALIRLADAGLGERPDDTGADVTSPSVIDDPTSTAFVAMTTSGSDGTFPLTDTNMIAAIHSLDDIAPFIFNILCLPAAPYLDSTVGVHTNMMSVISNAQTYCESKRAFLIVDIPETGVGTPAQMASFANNTVGLRHRNTAIYFPRIEVADPLNEGRRRNIGVSGTVAGIFARTDAARGVWKAPAGTEATLRGAILLMQMTDQDNGSLNPFGINALRSFPIFGNVIWGARTLDGADQQASEWKYIPVRRLALFLEESLFQGLKWVVFEPNDEPLWAQIRLSAGAFMQNLFRQGAFQGTTPRDAYFVKCDSETTTQNDIDLGIVNIVVGFAPLKPAEFVVIKIQQMAGQIEV